MSQYTFPKDLTSTPIIDEVLDEAYPVDIVVITVDNENPADKGLPGTWEAM